MEELICFDDFRGDCSVVSLFAYIYILLFFLQWGAWRKGNRHERNVGMSHISDLLWSFVVGNFSRLDSVTCRKLFVHQVPKCATEVLQTLPGRRERCSTEANIQALK